MVVPLSTKKTKRGRAEAVQFHVDRNCTVSNEWRLRARDFFQFDAFASFPRMHARAPLPQTLHVEPALQRGYGLKKG